MSSPTPAAQRPSLSLRLKSAMVMGMTGVLSKVFLYGFNRVEVTGLSRFLDLLESRRDPAKRQRGLLTGGISLIAQFKYVSHADMS
jgi:monolysocardiolipin acyltransferase